MWAFWVASMGVAAAAVPLVPGSVHTASRCDAALDAPCWDDIVPIRRFAPAPGLHVAPQQADVRIGWDADGLWVRIADLPAGAHVEVGVGRDERFALVDAGAWSAPGVHRLKVSSGVRAGDLRRLWVNLVVPDGTGSALLPWAPVGEADPDHPGRLLLVDKPSSGLTIDAETVGDTFRFRAIGGEHIHAAHLAMDIPAGSRGVPAPWSADGGNDLTVNASPDVGWHEVVAWADNTQGLPVALQAGRFWWQPPGPPGVSADALFFPPPRHLALLPGRPFRLSSDAGLCAPPVLAGVADLLVRETTRITGHTLGVREGDCGLTLALDPALPPDGFALKVTGADVRITGANVRAVAYGALAWVDALGPDGEMPRVNVEDAPAFAERPLFYSLNVAHRPDLTVADTIAFLERVVLRGRYSSVHLSLGDGLVLPSHPELAHRRAWEASQLEDVLEAARSVGLDVVPGVNAPGHSAWILKAHPSLAEDVNPSLLDLRNPGTKPLLEGIYSDTWSIFGRPTAMNFGHDEAIWQSQKWFGDERNPRSSATPRSLLFAEDLRFHLAWASEHGVTPYIWTDMLLADWNGARDGTHRVLDHLTEVERTQFRTLAWSGLGQPLDILHDQYGMDVLRVHTGYLDWKRAGLVADSARIAGEGLAVFVPAPWAAFGPGPGSRPLHHHLGSVLLAGATAWEPALEPAAHISPTLAALAGHFVLRPGFQYIAHRGARPLEGEGTVPDGRLPAAVWPTTLTSLGDVFSVDPRVAWVDQPVSWRLPRTNAAGLSVLLAVDLDHSAEARLRADVTQAASKERRAVATLLVEREDGSVDAHPLEYGTDIYAWVAGPRANVMWRSADVVGLASPALVETQGGGHDRRLYRIDLPLDPQAPRPVRCVLQVERAGVAVLTAGAVMLEAR